MSLKEWFEERRKISGLIKDLIGKASKDYIVNEMDKKKNLKVDSNNRLWVQCDNRENLLYIKYLRQNKSVCEGCGYHLQMSSSDRIKLLIDHGTRHPMDEDMAALDIIQFHYEYELHIDCITFYQIRTGLTDAIQTGIGRLNGIPIAIGVMDFKFMGGSMGSVVVTASFGMLGDIIIAEPKAYIAFAGKRVIEQTLGQKVPDGSQVAEHLFDHGLFDLIVPRSLLKGVLSELLQLYGSIHCKKE
eukprot:Gb_11364 [translate_table: standard]